MKTSSFSFLGYGITLVVMSVILFNCISFVDTKDVGVVYRLGKWNRTLPAGVHLTLPYPIERIEQLPIINTRNIDIKKPRILTGDANLIEAQLVVQYDIIEPKTYALSHADSDALLESVLQSILIRVVGHSKVDQETFVSRNLLESQIRKLGQEEINRLQLGISLRSIGFQDLSAPKAVIDAFNEISSARGEKDTMVLSAQSYASKSLPVARGEAQKIIEEAHSYRSEVINLAKTRCMRFNQLLPVWRTHPKMLRSTLKAQTWNNLKEKITVHHVSAGDHLILPEKKGDKP